MKKYISSVVVFVFGWMLNACGGTTDTTASPAASPTESACVTISEALSEADGRQCDVVAPNYPATQDGGTTQAVCGSEGVWYCR